MSRDGNGSYSLPEAAFVYDTVISETAVNSNFSDIAAALTASIAKDGQTVPAANLPMGTYRHTGVGNASARTDYASAGQVQDSAFHWCGTAGGTANAITLTPTPAITAYAAGQMFRFKAGASSNTSTVTFAISGLSTIAGQVNGAACSGDEIEANRWYRITLSDASTAQIEKIGAPLASAGDVSGPASATANALVLFNGTGGKTIKDSTYTITAAGAAILDDADAAAQRTTLGLGTAAVASTGTSAGNVVVLDGSAKLPAVDGSQLNNLPAGPFPSTLAFKAYKTVSGLTVPSDTTTVLQLNAEGFDIGSCYNTSTYRYTPNVAGYYLLTAVVFLTSVGTGKYVAGYILKNGVSCGNVTLLPGAADSSNAFVSTIVYANGSTDYFEAAVRHNKGSDASTTYGVEGMYFTGARVG